MTKLNRSQKIRIIHIINHLVVLSIPSFLTFTNLSISFLLWIIIGSLGVSAGFHRYLSHNSFTTNKFWEATMIGLGCLAMGGPPISWAAIHRSHHQKPDKEGDPHSPYINGAFKNHFHLWEKKILKKSLVKDLFENTTAVFYQKNYFKILFVYGALLLTIFGIKGFYIGFALIGVISFHSFGLINTLGHIRGYRNFETKDQSRNNALVAFFTMGEGWHNNHHKYPSYYRIGLKPMEFDVTAFLLEKLPIMKDHRKVSIVLPTNVTGIDQKL